MRNPKVFDCFIFWEEIDILFIRLKHLWNYVDKFVIVEANVTHRGVPKEWNLEKLIDTDFSWAKEKIIYIKKEIDVSSLDLTYVGETYNSDSPFWKIENEHRNAINEGLLLSEDEDIIMIGDLDEIPSKYGMESLMPILNIEGRYTMGMRNFNYYLNVENTIVHPSLIQWRGTTVGRRKDLSSPNEWRDERCLIIWYPWMGFHFSWIGKESVKKKLKATAHDELEKICTEDNIESAFTLGENGFFGDIAGNQSSSVLIDVEKDSSYPSVILENKERFLNLFYHK